MMTKVVHRYSIMLGANLIEMPIGAELLMVGITDKGPSLWVRVDPGHPTGLRKISVVGTGHDGAEGIHVGSMIERSTCMGDLVWHVFDDGHVVGSVLAKAA